MNKKAARAAGVDAGYEMARYCEPSEMTEEALTEEAFEAEENARQFSPFEFFASTVNRSRDPDGLWDAYNAGVAAGVKKGVRERLRG